MPRLIVFFLFISTLVVHHLSEANEAPNLQVSVRVFFKKSNGQIIPAENAIVKITTTQTGGNWKSYSEIAVKSGSQAIAQYRLDTNGDNGSVNLASIEWNGNEYRIISNHYRKFYSKEFPKDGGQIEMKIILEEGKYIYRN